MRIALFEDPLTSGLEPLTLTRPASDLWCGLTPLWGKQMRFFHGGSLGMLVRPHLAELVRLMHPHAAINDSQWLRQGPAVLVNTRWLPPNRPVGPEVFREGPHVGLVGEEIAYILLSAVQVAECCHDSWEERLHTWKRQFPQREAGGRMIARPWELIDLNAEQLRQDFARLAPTDLVGYHPDGVAVIGPKDRLFIDPTAQVDPFVAIDTRDGPVFIDAHAVVTTFSRLEGPCYIGRSTQILGAKVRAGSTLGPQCRIGGEIEASIIQGYTNKYHEGFLGHSYLGEWVNFGAGTHTSDLRCDYGEVRVIMHGRPVPTGRTKVGSLVGDHTKTGLGTLLNTGSHIGAFCILLPHGELLPRMVPSFGQVQQGMIHEVPDVDRLFATAREVMRRRGQTFTPVHEAVYRQLFEQTTTMRRHTIRDAEQRCLRRSA